MPSLVHQIAHPSALRAAWERLAARGSTYPGADGVTPAAFAADLERQLAGLAASLAAGTYAPRPLRRFWLRPPGRAPRPIDVAAVRDRVVQTALHVRLQARLEPLLAEAAFAYRPGRSPKSAARRLAAFCANGHPVVARGDVEAFFASISHARLLAQLDALVADPLLVDLVARFLAAPSEDVPPQAGRGLPAGCTLSPLLSNAFLLPFDRAFEAAGRPMVRYGDDFAVACASEADARGALRLAGERLAELGLALQARKSRLVAFEAGVPFLGRTVSPALLAPSAMPAASAHPPRTLYVQTQGATVGVEGERLVVRAPGSGEVLARMGLPRLGRLVLLGTVHLTSGALKRCLRSGVPVHVLTRRGEALGHAASAWATSAAVIRAQCAAASEPARQRALARALVEAKIRGQRALLVRRGRRLPEGEAREALRRTARRLRGSAREASRAPSVEALRGVEGAASAAYFGAFPLLLGEGAPLAFEGRSRRPPRDPVNALLSFAYTLAHRQVVSLLEMHRLHPYVGFLHEDRPGHATLASDLLELARPALDAFVLAAVRRHRFSEADFERVDGGGCYLAEAARARFLEAYERALRRPRRRAEGPPHSLWQRLAAEADRLAAALRENTPYLPQPLP